MDRVWTEFECKYASATIISQQFMRWSIAKHTGLYQNRSYNPSRDPESSEQDIMIINCFITAGKMMQIGDIDHVILGNDRNVSIMGHL
jgi:hypothetical protein